MTHRSTLEIGHAAERDACRYLEKQGLVLKEHNYRCKTGEIDLIMWEGDTLVFVEVRLRHNPDYGTSLATITPQKQRRIICAARYYLLENDLTDSVNCRFDAIGIDTNFDILWIKDAFQVQY